MSQQLVKKDTNGRYSNVMPKSWIEAIKDKNTGKTLVEILQSFNMYFLPYNGNSTSTRCLVPTMLRKKGLWITYIKYDGNIHTEWYVSEKIDDNSWGNSSNWRVGNNTLVGDITISANGNWVINGTETEFKAVGEKGNTPLVRFGSNNKFQVSYNNGEKWIDISDSITNNLKIKKYIGTNESLPTSGIEEGTIYMKGPYYAEDDALNNNPIYRMWVYAWKGDTLAWQDNGEFTSIAAGVVQETGNSETEVMSQKAVSTKLSELESEENRNRIYLEDIDVVIAELSVNTTTYMPTFPIVLNAGDVVHITPMLSGITSLDGVYLYYADGTREAIYTWGNGKLKVVNIDKKVTSIGFYYSSGTPTTDYIRFHYMGKAAILADIEPRFSYLESAESRLSANQQTIQTDIAAIENTANIVTISELTEDELVQQSNIRISLVKNITKKRVYGEIKTSVIDVVVRYIDINGNILYDSGWTRDIGVNTSDYSDVHTLELLFRNQSASSITKDDVVTKTNINLKVYGSLLQPSDITGEGNTEYYGEKINLNITNEKKYCNNTLLHTILNREDIPLLTSVQSLAIHDGIAIIPKDGTKFVAMDVESGELLYHGEFPQSHHNNAIQFSNTFYDSSDRFPLLLLSSGDYDNPSNKVMVLRISNDYKAHIVKEISCSIPNVQYNGSFVADFGINRLWLYTFTNGSYAVRDNNNVVIYEFTLPNIKTSDSVTLSKDDVLKETILPVCTMQDAVAYGGKLWFPCSHVDYINGYPTSDNGLNGNIFLVLNPTNGNVDNVIKGVNGLEPEGIDFYNGKMYFICKNSGVTEVGKTAFRLYEYIL